MNNRNLLIANFFLLANPSKHPPVVDVTILNYVGAIIDRPFDRGGGEE